VWSHSNVYLHVHDMVVFVAAAGTLGSVKDQLTKVMLQGAYATTIPVRNANDTVNAEVGLSLIQVIELV